VKEASTLKKLKTFKTGGSLCVEGDDANRHEGKKGRGMRQGAIGWEEKIPVTREKRKALECKIDWVAERKVFRFIAPLK